MENTVKDGKESCLGKSRSYQELQVEIQLSETLNLGLSRRQRGFKSRWGCQKNQRVAGFTVPLLFAEMTKI